jgi:SLBB domain-containing protein
MVGFGAVTTIPSGGSHARTGRIARWDGDCVAILIGTATSPHVAAQNRNQPRGLQASEFLSPVVITGEVNRPGTFPVIGNLTLVQLLEMAGGLTAKASRTAIVVHFSGRIPLSPPSRAGLVQLMRPGATIPSNITVTRIAMTDDQTRATPLHLEPQDILFIPAKDEG